MEEKKIDLISKDGEDEGYPGFGRKVPLNMVNKVAQSICKLTIKEENKNIVNSGTGFFMFINFEQKRLNCLVTNYHIIQQDLVDSKKIILIQIEKDNKEIEIQLDNNKRFIKCFKKPIDITIIEIKDSDQIINDVFFLWYDLNYVLGYEQYSESDILILQHPLGEETQLGIGKIMNIKYFEFEHSIETDNCSSGSPVILIGNYKVIGIHKQTNKKNNNGIGTFIGEIFKLMEEEKKEQKIINNEENKENNLHEKMNNIKDDCIIPIKISNISVKSIGENENNRDSIEDCVVPSNFKKIKIISFEDFELLEKQGLNSFRIKSKLKLFNYI